MSYEEFESTVASRYFASDHCQDDRLRERDSLDEAAPAIWPDFAEEETRLFQEGLARRLSNSAFDHVVVAQRFTPTMERTVEYLNATMSSARFYAVELVRFAADGFSAFESRTVLKPEPNSSDSGAVARTNEAQFLERIENDDYRDALQELLEVRRGLGLRIEWGAVGTSIRLPTPDRSEPLTIAWLFPPGVSGWQGLIDLNLGFDPWSAAQTPSVASALENYLKEVQMLPGAGPVKPKGLRAYHLNPESTVNHRRQIADIWAELIRQANE